jgi:hypothetical protein
MSTFTSMTKRTLKRILLSYNLEHDVDKFHKCIRTVDAMWCIDKSWVTDLKLKGPFPDYKRTRYRIKATWAALCFMYKQETGKDHEDA